MSWPRIYNMQYVWHTPTDPWQGWRPYGKYVGICYNGATPGCPGLAIGQLHIMTSWYGIMTSWYGSCFTYYWPFVMENTPVIGGFPSGWASNAELWCYLRFWTEQTVEQWRPAMINLPFLWQPSHPLHMYTMWPMCSYMWHVHQTVCVSKFW